MIIQFRTFCAIIGITILPGLLRTTNTLAEHYLKLDAQITNDFVPTMNENDTCAICLFGLPRSFENLVLPSIVTNILMPNVAYGCDIFVHYYDIGEEEPGRLSKGGKIDTHAIAHLEEAIDQVYNDNFKFAKRPDVVVVSDTDETFWDARGDTVDIYRHAKAEDGNFKYFPWKDLSYSWPSSIDNIVKQWHSISSVWNTMERHGQEQTKQYNRVGMFRSDVVYVTPIDMYSISKNHPDIDNKVAVIPNFATYPVNDRMIYGPYEAVEIWATERFSRLEEHALSRPGYGMHSEKYLHDSILPAIQDKGFVIEENKDICFFRARANGEVHLKDCDDNNRFRAISFRRKMNWVESVSNVTCTGRARGSKTILTRVNCE